MIMPRAAATTGATAVATAPGTPLPQNTFETQSYQLTLDGSKSSTTNSGDLTYSWAPAPGYPPVAITQPETPTPTIQFPTRGIYQINLTVTDRTGSTSTSAVTIRYI
jgi:hypothetical protein